MSDEKLTKVAAIIVAAGRGVRAGGDLPKQWRQIAGKPVAAWTIDAFFRHSKIDEIVVVTHPDDEYANDILADFEGIKITHGAETRDGSVRAGLAAVTAGTTHVLIHDVARPCVTPELISSLLDQLKFNHAAAPGLSVTDALWVGTGDLVQGTQDRTALYRAQTPQAFNYPAILAAHNQAAPGAADDVEVARQAGIEVAIVAGDESNLKITTPADFDRAEAILKRKSENMSMDVRVGNGFDVHRFGEGDHVTLCGIDIPHGRGLQGHSDADVGLHTVTDAIYGAMSEGDIGTHFPPTDPQWKGAASHIFLEHARDMALAKGFTLTHIDCTLICERPKVGPHALTMRRKLSEILNIDLDRVSVKATTSERLGFTGREEGIACMATATLVKS